MKRFLAPILLVTLLFPSFALAASRGLEMDDLVERGGLYYEKFTDVPFSGKIEGLERGSFKDGKQDGPWVSYYENGQLYGKGTWKDGKQDGLWVSYYKNGQLYGETTFKDGVNDGPLVSYYEDGQLSEKGTYKDGERDGPWVGFNKDGTVNEEWTGTFKDNVKVE
jgi:antitoxin component YwqK of YwqJK toxin-antitoxin module